MSERKMLKVKNWEQFQHYSKRNPPWIKLHRSLLDDRAFMALADASKCLLLLAWLIASENGGEIPADPEEVAFRLRKKSVDLKPLIDNGFLIDASNALAGASNVLPQRQRQRQIKSETNGGGFPENLNTESFAKAWLEWEQHRTEKRQSLTPSTIEKQLAKLAKLGHERAIAAINHSIENGYIGIFEPKPNGHKPQEQDRSKRPTLDEVCR